MGVTLLPPTYPAMSAPGNGMGVAPPLALGNSAATTAANNIVPFRQPAPPAPWAQPPQRVQSFTSPSGTPIHLYVLGNGHRVLVEQRPTDVISMRTFINAGSINENPIFSSGLYGPTGSPSGIAHLDEHCHFLTTQHFPVKNSWVAAVEQLGSQLNASTGYEVIQHELFFNKEALPQMIRLHGEAVMHPLYNRDLLVQEKRNVLNEASERTASPEAQIYNKTLELLFDRPHFQSLGVRQDVINTSAEQLQTFFNRYYTPTNMLTVISGDVNPETVVAQLNEDFGSNPNRGGPNNASLKIALKPGEIRSATVYDPQLTYGVVNLTFPAPGKNNLKDRVAMECLLTLLNDGALSLFQRYLQDQWKLATEVGVEYMPTKTAGMAQIGFHTTPGDEKQALGATLAILKRMNDKPISAEKLQEVKNKLLYGYQRSLNDAEVVTSLMGSEALTGTLTYFNHYADLVGSITPDDIQRVAQQYLNPQSYVLVYGLPGPQRALSNTTVVQGQPQQPNAFQTATIPTVVYPVGGPM
ncbi:MAG: pitrilysin family protein [Candidatus Melainabacteria bacterium]|nr:pitrilysin family protein [Candidatus Melainabacteria bacterium]